jgi:hypothetical protein
VSREPSTAPERESQLFLKVFRALLPKPKRLPELEHARRLAKYRLRAADVTHSVFFLGLATCLKTALTV